MLGVNRIIRYDRLLQPCARCIVFSRRVALSDPERFISAGGVLTELAYDEVIDINTEESFIVADATVEVEVDSLEKLRELTHAVRELMFSYPEVSEIVTRARTEDKLSMEDLLPRNNEEVMAALLRAELFKNSIRCRIYDFAECVGEFNKLTLKMWQVFRMHEGLSEENVLLNYTPQNVQQFLSHLSFQCGQVADLDMYEWYAPIDEAATIACEHVSHIMEDVQIANSCCDDYYLDFETLHELALVSLKTNLLDDSCVVVEARYPTEAFEDVADLQDYEVREFGMLRALLSFASSTPSSVINLLKSNKLAHLQHRDAEKHMQLVTMSKAGGCSEFHDYLGKNIFSPFVLQCVDHAGVLLPLAVASDDTLYDFYKRAVAKLGEDDECENNAKFSTVVRFATMLSSKINNLKIFS